MVATVFNTRMRYVRRPLALCAICSLLLPAAALGQRGAQLDPDSPAGVEYQLPLEQARKNALAGDRDGPRARADHGGRRGGLKSLFGAGIVAAKAGVQGRGGGDGDASQGGRGAEQGTRGSDADDRGDPDASSSGRDIRQSALGGADQDGGSAALRIAGVALAVLLVGALLGFALRRGLRESTE